MAIKVPTLKYERFTIEKFEQAAQKWLEDISNAKSAEELIAARKGFMSVTIEFTTMATLSYIRFTQDTRDEFFVKEQEYYDEINPLVNKYMIMAVKAFMANANADSAFKQLPETLKPMYECALKGFDEKIIPDMQAEGATVTEYSKLISGLMFEFRGEKIPLTILRKYMCDKDRATRAEAYNVLGKTLEENSAALDDIFDRLVKIRTKMAQKLGYKDYVELAYYLMSRICYDRKSVEKMRNNILQDVVPVVSKIRTERAKEMGIDEMKLYDYDCVFSCGDPEPVLSAEDMFTAGKQMYHEMNENTADFIDEMLENEAFDYESREGKWGGGYMTELPAYNQMFILANFNGTSADVDVLTHEAGHAFAGYMLAKNNVDPEINMGGMETAETHSMSMEFFCWKWMDKFFGERVNDYKFKHVTDSLTFLTYGIIVDYFQHVVYENPDMTPAERKAVWKKMEQEFRPYMNADGIPYLEQGTRWQYQMHIYERPFYYIDYVIAQSTALQFLMESRKDYDDAFRRYYKLLEQGGTKFYTELLKEAGLKSPFEEGELKEVAKGAAELVKELEG